MIQDPLRDPPFDPVAFLDGLLQLARERWPVLVAIFAAVWLGLDALLRHGRTAKMAWKGARAAMAYLRDLFLAPIKIRKLERAMPDVQPVYHLGAVWLPSDVEDNRAEPFCQVCWADGKKIALAVTGDGVSAYFVCAHDRKHGTDMFGHPRAIERKLVDHARGNALNRRLRLGA